MEEQKQEQSRTGSNNTPVKIAAIIGLVFASPLLIVFGFFTIISVVAIVFGTMGEYLPFLLIGLLLASLLPAIRQRISNRQIMEDMQKRVEHLESELTDARHQIVMLEEAADFDARIASASGRSSQSTTSERLSLPNERQIEIARR